ncbi:hypothetical protein [Salimicrobium jeotgali]|uniref:hypothetical protein n=1 Tax=Salimicrobium jeotgali TaxID=1230341 RepID=UPI000C819EE3|nr:hypothetical protein [Salimicrobium jeotgali]
MQERDKEVEDMKEFMTILIGVRETLAEQSVKLDNALDVKHTADEAKDTANRADRRSQQNAKDIEDLEEDIKEKADQTDVERIIKEKDNWQRNLPSWVAVIISIIVFISQYITLGG